MAEIVPFTGVRYNSEKVEKLEQVVAPPYDVIASQEQDALYAASPYNFVRIILNRAEPGDQPESSPYTRAAHDQKEWLDSGILCEEGQPSLYVYRQEFTNPADGARYTRTGFFCALKLEPYSAGVVLPHEETRTKAREDRLRLMRALCANPEPILGLYEDAEDTAAGVLKAGTETRQPDIYVTVGGDHHAVWRVSDEKAIAEVQSFLKDRRVWIADGHHRYETALTYRDERRATEGDPAGAQPYDYILIVLTSFSDPGMVVLPTHRLIKNVSVGRMEQLLLQLERYFDVEAVAKDDLPVRMRADVSQGEHRFGMVSAKGSFVLTLRDESVMDAAVEGHAPVWKRLDVSILQALVLERSLGIPAEALATTPDVAYTRDRAEAAEQVASGECQLAFLLNLPAADEVRQVAAAGDKMPPKSTFFYPKLWSGLLMRRL